MRRIVLFVLLVLGALPAGCGGGDGGGQDAERDFRGEAERLCREYNSDVLRREVPSGGDESDAFFDELAEREKQLFEDLGELDPPEDVAQPFERGVRGGDQGKAARHFIEIGLDECAGYGVHELPNGVEFGDRAKTVCEPAIAAIRRAGRGPAGVRRVRAVAGTLQDLRGELDALAPPQEAEEMWETALEEIRTTAEVTAGYLGARSRAEARELDLKLDRSYARGSAAWFLLNVEECSNLYDAIVETSRSR